MVVADAEISLTITGNGDVLEPYDGVIGMAMLFLFCCALAFNLCYCIAIYYISLN